MTNLSTVYLDRSIRLTSKCLAEVLIKIYFIFPISRRKQKNNGDERT